jgi:hypothetical protein
MSPSPVFWFAKVGSKVLSQKDLEGLSSDTSARVEAINYLLKSVGGLFDFLLIVLRSLVGSDQSASRCKANDIVPGSPQRRVQDVSDPSIRQLLCLSLTQKEGYGWGRGYGIESHPGCRQ